MIDWERWTRLPHKYVLFSGGKDSTVVLHLVHRHIPDVKALHIDSTCALREVKPHVERVCNLMGVPLEIARPRVDFFTLCKRKGAPTIKRRWCMYELKIKALKGFFDQLGCPREEIVVFDGRKASDSWKRRKFFERIGGPYNIHAILKVHCVAPIWNWSDEEVERYSREFQLPINPLYSKLGMGGDCICPVYKRKKFWLRLKYHFPEVFEKLVELEASFRMGGSFAVYGSKKIYMSEIKKQRFLDEYLKV